MRLIREQSAEEALIDSRQPPSPEEVRAQLARILGSAEFAVPERLRSFLRYIVEQTVDGYADQLKGYTIATAVFQRGEGFDPQADPVVRIEAARLRRALERYYLVAGHADPVLIEVPKGGYVPDFTNRMEPLPPTGAAAVPEEAAEASRDEIVTTPARRWRLPALVMAGLAALLCLFYLRSASDALQTAEATLPDSPTLLVLPVASLGDGDEARLYAAGLFEELLAKLSRLKEVTVLGGEADTGPSTTAQAPSPRYVLAGSLRASGPKLRVTSRLEDSRTGVALWVQTYEADLRTNDLFKAQEDIALQVATAVAQPYGVVFRSDLVRTADQPPGSLEPYACTLRFYVYRADPAQESHARIRDCLERTVERFPNNATALAMFSLLALDEDRFAFNQRPGMGDPIERARQTAQRAVDLDPNNARALQALMMALFFRGEVEEATRIGKKALAANPNDSELLSEFGLRIALAGEWQRGRELVEQALARDAAYSGYYHAALALIAYLQRDYDRAELEIRQASLTSFSIYHVVAAMIFAERGLANEARHEAALFTKLHPTFMPNLDAEMRKRNLRPDDRAHLVEGLVKAGLPVPEEVTEQIARSRSPGH